jgi:predicted transcriptional regulator YdeE
MPNDPLELDFSIEEMFNPSADPAPALAASLDNIDEEKPGSEVIEKAKPSDIIIPALEEDEEGEVPAVNPLKAVGQDAGTEAETTITGEIRDYFGYELDEEFEDTPEGLKALTKTIGEKMAMETLDEIFNAHPTIKAHLEYVQNGGDPNNFMRAFSPEVDYSTVKLEEDTPEAREVAKVVLKTYFQKRGDDPAFVDDMIEAYEDKGEIIKKGNAAAAALASVQASERNYVMEQQRAQRVAQEEASKKTWETVTDLVTKSDSLGGLAVAPRERTKFLDYISKPIDKHGRTQRDLDSSKLSLEQQLAADFLLYKGMDLGKITGTRATTAAAQTLKERMAGMSKKVKGSKQPSSPSGNVIDSLDLSMDNF